MRPTTRSLMSRRCSNDPLLAVPQNFRWPVAGAIEIAAPAERVWATISTPGNLEPCHPFCESNPVQHWPGPDSKDEVRYLGGWTYQRHFKSWHEGVGYDLTVGRQGGGSSLVSWRIAPVTAASATLTITVYPHSLQHLPVAIRWLPHHLRLRPLLNHYLSSVVRGFEWYITRGEPVPRNQFGHHPWFSPAH